MAFKTRRPFTKTLRKGLQKIVHEYIQEHHVDSVDLETVAEWAVLTGRYQRQPMTMVKQCKRELARACREEMYTDPQGRDVRKMHAARYEFDGKQMRLWADITTAKPGHMRVSFSQRRQAVLADCRQHKTDVESYNDNNRFKVSLPLFDYNFNTDLEEEQFPKDYPEDKPKSQTPPAERVA